MVMIPQRAADAIKVIAAKLGEALFYFHLRELFPKHGRLWFRFFPNVISEFDHNVYTNFLSVTDSKELIKRSRKDLREQFDYSYFYNELRGFVLFSVSFSGEMFKLFIIASRNPNVLTEIDSELPDGSPLKLTRLLYEVHYPAAPGQ